MTQAIAQNINDIMKFKEKIFFALVGGIAIFVFSYIYFLHGAISNVVAREDIVKEDRAVSTQVSELESKYFQVKNTINLKLAHEKGFKDSEVVSFISTKKPLTAMANNNDL